VRRYWCGLWPACSKEERRRKSDRKSSGL